MSTVNYINAALEIWGCVMSVVVAICLLISKSNHGEANHLYFQMLVCNTSALFCDLLALLFRGNPGALCWWGVRISNFIAFCSNYLLLVIFVHYLTVFLSKRTKVSTIPLFISRIICGGSIILVVATQFYPIIYTIDAQNVYHRAGMFWLSHATGLVCMCFCAWMLMRYHSVLERQEKIGFWSYIILPVVALIIQMFVYGIVLLNLANTITLIIVFLFLQADQGRRIAEQEASLSENRIAIMLSQIQPHFLYNALNTIQYLCETQPKRASLAVGKFSKYLRANMDSLTQKEPIPFEQELTHLENYLYIERLRFPDMQITYDLQIKDFHLPALTLQPLVENAIKHGVRQKESDGCITISAWQDEGAWCVCVADDGEGFDTEQLPQDGRSHVGISNTRSRLKAMCEGELNIESKLGRGTTVTIIIPKEARPCK